MFISCQALFFGFSAHARMARPFAVLDAGAAQSELSTALSIAEVEKMDRLGNMLCTLLTTERLEGIM